jgi:hypothetical protein
MVNGQPQAFQRIVEKYLGTLPSAEREKYAKEIWKYVRDNSFDPKDPVKALMDLIKTFGDMKRIYYEEERKVSEIAKCRIACCYVDEFTDLYGVSRNNNDDLRKVMDYKVSNKELILSVWRAIIELILFGIDAIMVATDQEYLFMPIDDVPLHIRTIIWASASVYDL